MVTHLRLSVADGSGARPPEQRLRIHISSRELLGRQRTAKWHPQGQWDEEHREYPQGSPHKLSFGGNSD